MRDYLTQVRQRIHGIRNAHTGGWSVTRGSERCPRVSYCGRKDKESSKEVILSDVCINSKSRVDHVPEVALSSPDVGAVEESDEKSGDLK